MLIIEQLSTPKYCAQSFSRAKSDNGDPEKQGGLHPDMEQMNLKEMLEEMEIDEREYRQCDAISAVVGNGG